MMLIFQSAEDQELKEKLELCVERLSDTQEGLRSQALEMIKTEVAGATSSMTAVPKPLKFLTPLYKKLTEIYEKYAKDDDFKVSSPFNQILSHIILLNRKNLLICAQLSVWLQPKKILQTCFPTASRDQ